MIAANALPRRIVWISMLSSIMAMSALATMSAAGAQTTPRPITPAEGRHQPYTGQTPLCDDRGVVRTITKRFQQRERSYWKSGLAIEGYERIRETGLRTAGLDLIPKRYCQADALMNDGRKRRVTYWIGENLGFIGMKWGVEWCIEGLDHHRAFSPDCRAAGP